MKAMLRAVSVAIVMGAVCARTTLAQNEDAKTNPKVSPPAAATPDQKEQAKRPDATHGYLGVAVDPLHSALINHLSSIIGGEYGLLVAEVGEGTPAAKAGIKPDDIIFRYEDQKLFYPQQFIRLVHADPAGRDVTLGVLHEGQAKDVKVKLGEQQVLTSDREERTAFRRPFLPWFGRAHRNEETSARWSTFDSLSLNRLGEDKFKIEIKYRDTNGKMESRKFEGSREEIRQAIEAQKDLPDNERNHLLRGLDLENNSLEPVAPENDS
jgi:PDZ domain